MIACHLISFSHFPPSNTADNSDHCFPVLLLFQFIGISSLAQITVFKLAQLFNIMVKFHILINYNDGCRPNRVNCISFATLLIVRYT